MIDFFKPFILQTINKGWNSVENTFIESSRLQAEFVQFDKSWAQGFWGIWLTLHDDETEKVKYQMQFLTGIYDMIRQTRGIFIRDNSATAIAQYLDGDTTLEASKDQMLGLITAVYLIWETSNHSTIKLFAQDILKAIKDSLVKHGWFLYNELEKRNYNSANYMHVHFWGLNKVFNRVFGVFRKRHILEYPLMLLGWTINVMNIQLLRGVKKQQYWWQNIKCLEKYPWYGKNFTAGIYDFNINLVFFEFLIAGFENKRVAEKIIRQLETNEAIELNHINLAALYLFLCRKWKIIGMMYPLYEMLLNDRDGKLYLGDVLPNERRIGSFWVCFNAFYNHEILTDTEFKTRLGSAIVPATNDDLMAAGARTRVVCNNGLMYVVRKYLQNYK